MRFWLNILIYAVFLSTLSHGKAIAEIILPSPYFSPIQVLEIQLRALQENDDLYENAGITQTWAFAHPENKKVTGPLKQFIKMIRNTNYKTLLEHHSHSINVITKNEKKYVFNVNIRGKDTMTYNFNWEVRKVVSDTSLKDCWLTMSVSGPKVAGDSI